MQISRASTVMSEAESNGQDNLRCPRLVWSWPILVSAIAWAAIITAIPPAKQEFPLGDDWAFQRGAIWFAQGQGVHYSLWASMPQLGQWLWSLPFVLVFGPSHFALRVSTILLSWVGLVCFYDQLRREGIASRLAGFAACVVALNPLFFVSQGTYMTDVPALSFGLIALNFYTRAIGQRHVGWLAAATAIAVAGVVTRQTLIAVPIVAGVLLLRRPDFRLKPIWALSVLLPLVVCAVTHIWFVKRPDVLPLDPINPSPEKLALVPFLAVHLCGLAVLPLCLLIRHPRSWRMFGIALAAMLLTAGWFFFTWEGLPYGGAFPYCKGMLSLWGTYTSDLVVGERTLLLTPALRTIITILGCVGGAAIATSAGEVLLAKRFPGPLMIFTLLQAAFLIVMPKIYDRYVEVIFPGAVYLIAAQWKQPKLRWRWGVVSLALYGVLSMALMHDWLSWNSARWELGRQAVDRGVEPAAIEGGFEWDGWYGSANPGRPMWQSSSGVPLDRGPSLTLRFSRKYFPHVQGRYALAFTQPTNSFVIASNQYRLWLSSGPKDFFLVGHVSLRESRPEP